MNLSKRNVIIFLLFLILGSRNFLSTAWADSFNALKLDAKGVPWSQLSFHAKNFWVEVSTDVQLVSMPAAAVQPLLISTPKGIPVKIAALEASQMTINTKIDPRFRSAVNLYSRIWFNPADAAALGRLRLRRGDDDFKKIYRFTRQGVFRHRREPKNKKEFALAPENWTDTKDSFYPYDLDGLGCAAVSESSLLIYIISVAAASMQEDALSLCVFGKRQLHRVVLRKAGVYPISVNFVEKKKQVETLKQGIVKTIKITLTAKPLKSDLNEPENFSFLGFHKDISIHVDPTTHLPIQASGMIPTAGKAKLNLLEAQIKSN